jgi:hypothetical protein
MLRTSLLALAATTVMAVVSASVATPAVAQFLAAPINPKPNPSTYDCSTELGHLRRVYTAQLDAVEDNTQVWVTPVCLNDDSVFRSEGNAGALRGAIASNDAMLTALFAANYGPEDVVGVRMLGDDKVTLFVHPFHH